MRRLINSVGDIAYTRVDCKVIEHNGQQHVAVVLLLHQFAEEVLGL